MSPTAKKQKIIGVEDGGGASCTSEENPSVKLFRDYIRIKSVQPKPDYAGCMKFLKAQAKKIGLPVKVVEPIKGKPVLIMSWVGLEPNLPSLLLNSHTDVVPVYPECWKYDAFEAVKEENGDIYGRGTQDMKCVAIQHLEAIRRLKADGKKYKRTIHLSFIPDEEIGGAEGMKRLLVSKEFTDLNVGFALDEGIASGEDEPVVPVFFGERNTWWVKFRCLGTAGHGSQFLENTAGQKAQYLINKLLGYREEQRKKLESDQRLTLGDVTSVNLTMMSGGVQMNVVPQEFTVGFDIRVTPSMKFEDFEKMINDWAKEACASSGGDGNGVQTTYVTKSKILAVTSIDDKDPWFKAFKTATEKVGLKIDPRIFPGATDSRFLREIGIPALGFSPMPNTPMLLHAHNEMLNEKVFLKGIDVFVEVIDEMAKANC